MTRCPVGELFDAGTWSLRRGRASGSTEADVENAAPVRAIEKAGFRREGVLRAHCETRGRRHDCVMSALVQHVGGGVDPRDHPAAV